MTNQEAITIIGNLEDKDILFNPCDVQDAKTMAIKSLEQEPTIGQLFSCEELEELRKKIWKQVEQESKTGHWVGIDEEPHEDYECDICGYMCSTFTANIKPSEEYKYCPNCGCRMESEGSE